MPDRDSELIKARKLLGKAIRAAKQETRKSREGYKADQQINVRASKEEKAEWENFAYYTGHTLSSLITETLTALMQGGCEHDYISSCRICGKLKTHIDNDDDSTALITPKEVCEKFKIHRMTLRRWTDRGKLKSVNINSRKIYYKQSDIEDLLNESQMVDQGV